MDEPEEVLASRYSFTSTIALEPELVFILAFFTTKSFALSAEPLLDFELKLIAVPSNSTEDPLDVFISASSF